MTYIGIEIRIAQALERIAAALEVPDDNGKATVDFLQQMIASQKRIRESYEAHVLKCEEWHKRVAAKVAEPASETVQ